MTSHDLYMIYSGKSLREIEEVLSEYGDSSPVIRLDRNVNKDGTYTESNRTIVLMKVDVYQNLVNDGFGDRNGEVDFRVVPYRIRKKSHPRNGMYKMFLKLPLVEFTYQECLQVVTERINAIIERGMMTKKDYSIWTPMLSRDSDSPTYKGYSVISLGNDLKNDVKVKIKVLLDQTKWSKEGHTVLGHIKWYKKPAIKFKSKYPTGRRDSTDRRDSTKKRVPSRTSKNPEDEEMVTTVRRKISPSILPFPPPDLPVEEMKVKELPLKVESHKVEPLNEMVKLVKNVPEMAEVESALLNVIDFHGKEFKDPIISNDE